MYPNLLKMKTWLIVLLMMGCATSLFAQLQPTAAPAATSSYTLEDLYKRLNAGTAGAQATFAEPATGPTTTTMHTVNQIMAKAPLLDAANGADASMVLSGKTFWGLLTGTWGITTGSMPNNGAVTYTPGTTDQTIAAGYHNGLGKVASDPDLTAANIKTGVEIFGVTGNNMNIATPNAGVIMYFDGANWVQLSASSIKSATTQVPTMTSAGVTFNGVVNPNGLSTIVAFEYGTDTNYGATVTATPSPVSSTTNTTVASAAITTLTVGTTYHARLITQNIFGIFYGNDITFTYLYIGASYAGGLVFSVDNIGLHGKVCAPSDQSWRNFNFVEAVTYFVGNSLMFGFQDWYLPTPNDFKLMYDNLHINGLGNFNVGSGGANDFYWTSDGAMPPDRIKVFRFIDGTTFMLYSSYSLKVRVIRQF